LSSTLLGSAVATALAALLVWQFLRARRRRDALRLGLYARVVGLLSDARFEEDGSIGYPKYCGHYRGFPVQVLAVVDTLPVRRLPALWLLVTLQNPLPLQARFDLMMRPNGPTTFSNFDSLQHIVAHQQGLPESAVLRTDNPERMIPASVIAPHTGIFSDPRAKELLITSNGLRFVWLLAEASRARYGVFRQADFDVADIDPGVLVDLLDRLIDIRTSVLEWTTSHT
jgi:hypothetical protein